MKDLYAVLGLDKAATAKEIRDAYRMLALRHHPDRNGGSKESEDIFREINAAYGTLSDDTKRKLYDMERRRPVPPPPGQHGPASASTDIEPDWVTRRKYEAVRNSWFYTEGQKRRRTQNGQRPAMGSSLTTDPFEQFRGSGGLIAPIELGVPIKIVGAPSPLGRGINVVKGDFGTLPGFFMKKPGE